MWLDQSKPCRRRKDALAWCSRITLCSPTWTFGTNVAYGVRDKSERESRVGDVLDLVGLSGNAKTPAA